MKLNKKESSFLKLLNKHSVKYLIVGGMAVEHFIPSRKRKDIDIWVEANESNANNIIKAIELLIGVIPKLTTDKLSKENVHFPLSKLGYNIDILTSLQRVSYSFSEAYESSETHTIEGIFISFIGKDKLIESKLSANESKDIEDVKLLKKYV